MNICHFLRVALAGVALAAVVQTPTPALADDVADEFETESFDRIVLPAERGFSIQLDNDLFSGAHRDEDYSWGGAVTFASPQTRRMFRPIDTVRGRLASWLTPGAEPDPRVLPGRRAAQIGIIGMTPSTLKSTAPLFGDRPFASLLFINSGELLVLEGGDRARFTSFTVGALGLDLAGELHQSVHKLVGDEKPHGWEHQISSGGELTARYLQAQQWLITPSDPLRGVGPELKLTAAGSAGFLTEASVALSARWGRIQTPWWSFNPELGDYIAAPVAPVTVLNPSGLTEFYAFAGARLKARAYNALLQGQFRHSDIRVHSDELAHVHGEAWIGLASRWSDWNVAYTLRYATRETTREPGARSLIWAGINVEKTF